MWVLCSVVQYEGESVNRFTNGSKTAVMDIIGFLCVSIDSSRVQHRMGIAYAFLYAHLCFLNKKKSR
jgi:hypothetical protein